MGYVALRRQMGKLLLFHVSITLKFERFNLDSLVALSCIEVN
jgi:hypothetical protein